MNSTSGTHMINNISQVFSSPDAAEEHVYNLFVKVQCSFLVLFFSTFSWVKYNIRIIVKAIIWDSVQSYFQFLILPIWFLKNITKKYLTNVFFLS